MKLISKAQEVLGSHINIIIPQTKISNYVLSECFAELQRIQSTYSRFLDSSELSHINKQLGKWHNVSDEFIWLLTTAKSLQSLTNGHFDITVKSTLDRLGYDKNYSFVEKSENTLSMWQKLNSYFGSKFFAPIVIDKKNKRILLRKEIEIGGFGKGFAIDQIRTILARHNVSHYFINAGGDVYAKCGVGQKKWDVLLENPDDVSRAFGRIKLDGAALACSAPNRRKWKAKNASKNGANGAAEKEYHHLINVKTNLPQNSVKAIFVLAKTGIEADGYATALFTAGYKEAIRLSRSLPVKMLIISAKNEMFASAGFKIEFL